MLNLINGIIFAGNSAELAKEIALSKGRDKPTYIDRCHAAMLIVLMCIWIIICGQIIVLNKKIVHWIDFNPFYLNIAFFLVAVICFFILSIAFVKFLIKKNIWYTIVYFSTVIGIEVIILLYMFNNIGNI